MESALPLLQPVAPRTAVALRGTRAKGDGTAASLGVFEDELARQGPQTNPGQEPVAPLARSHNARTQTRIRASAPLRPGSVRQQSQKSCSISSL